MIGEQMFAGLLVNVDSLGDWISWIKYLSCVRYSLNVSRFFASHQCCVAGLLS